MAGRQGGDGNRRQQRDDEDNAFQHFRWITGTRSNACAGAN
jgi:hypothetical protein